MSKKITVSKAIGEALHEEMLRDEKVFIMGEDMAVMGNVYAITQSIPGGTEAAAGTVVTVQFGDNSVLD